MKLYSVKKYLPLRACSLHFLLLGAIVLGAGHIACGASVQLLKGLVAPKSFPYRPFWDFALTAKKQGVKPTLTKLLQPPVVYAAVPAVIACGVWAYCELELLRLQYREMVAKRERDAAFPSAVTAGAQLSALQAQVINQRVEERSNGVDLWGWRVWLAKWASFALSSVGFMVTYKLWQSDRMTN